MPLTESLGSIEEVRIPLRYLRLFYKASKQLDANGQVDSTPKTTIVSSVIYSLRCGSVHLTSGVQTDT